MNSEPEGKLVLTKDGIFSEDTAFDPAEDYAISLVPLVPSTLSA
jgi:hypothetical protein